MASIRIFCVLVACATLPNAIALRSDYWDVARFKADSHLVLVPVTVTNHRGATLSGLTPEAFTVFDDRLPQLILSFNEQDIPYSVGVIFDVSGSMKDKLPQAKAALRSFLKDANHGDEALLMSVSDGPSVRTRFTHDFGTVLEASSFSRAGGNTALVDTIYLGLTQMRRARNVRKALLVISDGIDNQSRYTARELMSAAVEADVQIYTLAIGEPNGTRKGIELLERARGLSFLSDLSEKTGGLHFVVLNASEMRDAARQISRALRNQYVLGYRPASPGASGKWHAIQVKLHLPDTRVYARQGYYSP